MFEPNGHKEYLKHDKYHHEDKGCNVIIRKIETLIGGIIIEKYCQTHQVECSKTGWEYGYYQGTDSKKIFSIGECYHLPCTKKLVSKKLDLVLGFINEYQKANYHDRIKCHQYNELVEKADMLISRTIKRRLNKNV